MGDFVFIAVIVGFFGLCVLYVKGCERILEGTEEAADIPAEVQR